MSEKFPEIDLNFRPLYDLLIGVFHTELLLTSVKLKIFNHCEGFSSSEQIAENIDSHPENTRFFLNGLVAMDLLIKKNEFYKNTSLSQKFLVEGVPIYLGDFISKSSEWYKPILGNLAKFIKRGPPTQNPSAGLETDKMWVDNARKGANYIRAGAGQHMAKIISELPEFPNLKKMLDLGGGSGLMGLCIVDAHPTMKGVIYDQPSVVEVAKEFISEYEMEDRVDVIGGDYLKDSIGEGYDLIFASSTLNFAKPTLDSFFGKVYDSLNPGGLFITNQDGFKEEYTKPASLALSFLTMTLTGMGNDMAFRAGEIAEAMIRTGFKSVQTREITKFFDVELTIGRK
jgi:hypothetical protein